MIISGDFICLSKGEDYEDEVELPIGVWFNINNIVAFSYYEHMYKLFLSEDQVLQVKQPAANKLIAFMRKERDEEVKKNLELLKKEPGFKEALKYYFRHVKKEKGNGNEK